MKVCIVVRRQTRRGGCSSDSRLFNIPFFRCLSDDVDRVYPHDRDALNGCPVEHALWPHLEPGALSIEVTDQIETFVLVHVLSGDAFDTGQLRFAPAPVRQRQIRKLSLRAPASDRTRRTSSSIQ
jgi:hypothetical protein